jgi:hypothetical protein
METIYEVKSREIILDDYDDYIDLWFWGDVHRDAKSCDEDRWKQFLKKADKGDKDKTYYIGLGDYMDFASDREQKKLLKEGYALHETTMDNIHELVEKQNRKFVGEISQMRGKLLGLVDGNHNWKFPNGVTGSEDLANRMGCDHLGWLCYFSLKFKFEGTTKRHNVDIIVCHGKGGGKRAGASINQVEDLKGIFPLADIYCMGHDHQLWVRPTDVLYKPSGFDDLKQKTQYLCRSGSFKKAYTPGAASYEVGGLFKPATLGALKLRISIERTRKDRKDRLRPVIEATI